MADFTTSDLITNFLKETTLSGAEMDSIREDLGIKTTDAVTFKNLILTALSLTGSQATGSVDIAATWNTTGTPTAFKINVTNTASNSASSLMDLCVDGASKFKIRRDGFLLSGGSIQAGGSVWGSGNGVVIDPGAGSYLGVGSNSYIGFISNNSNGFSAPDIFLRAGSSPATIQIGTNHATTATNQTLKAHNVTTGTGADLILSGGTGSAASGKVRTSTLGVFTLGPYTERIALTYSATLTPDCNDGLSRSVAMTGDQVINAPTNGVSGMILTLKMLASGADRELTFHTDIKKPTGATYEATVVSGSTRVIQLEYNGTAWMMIKNLEFVA